jgi:pyruvate dehydrogenase E1 component alpha subunit
MLTKARTNLVRATVAPRARVFKSTRAFATKAAHGTVAVKLEPEQFKMHNLPAPNLTIETSKQELLEFYREMQVMRRMEVAADGMYKQKLIRGFLHLYIGQEAVCAGLESALTKDDQVITAYRDHAHMITRRCGATVKEVLAELTGRVTGCSKGKGGSMHMYKADSHFFGGNGIVGAQIPLGAGLAFAQKYFKTGRVSVSYMGDGAANQGQVNEAYNMAQLWKLPAIFVVENNQYGMGTAVERASATKEFYTRGDYIPGLQFDGMDVLASRVAGLYAVHHAQTKGPIVLEAKTYRYQGHSMSDPGTTYRTREEIQKMRETRDPIEKVKSRLFKLGFATEEDLKAIDAEVKVMVDEAVEFAKSSPEPPAEDLFSNIYREPTPVRHIEFVNNYVPRAH